MIAIGINPAHNATACLIKDGQIIAAVSEERLTRIKNTNGYPRKAVEHCLRMSNLRPEDIDYVAISYKNMWALDSEQWVKEIEQEKKRHSRSRNGLRYVIPQAIRLAAYCLYNGLLHWDITSPVWRFFLRLFFSTVTRRNLFHHPFMAWEAESQYETVMSYASEKKRKKLVTDHLGIDAKKVLFFDHHYTHACYAYFGSPFRGEKVLILTADAVGDNANASVYIADEQANLTKISDSYNLNSLGTIYMTVTNLLGMKPLEHEYKVMGLAPYAKDEDVDRVYPVFEKRLKVQDLKFVEPEKPLPFSLYPGKLLLNYRFDWIAGAVQRFTENLLRDWVRNAVNHTGIRKVVFSGGVAMNVKATMVMAELSEITDFFVCPSGGDESTALGAAYAAMSEYCAQHSLNKKMIAPLPHVYLGNEYTREEIEQAIEEYKLDTAQYEIMRGVPDVAQLAAMALADGKTVARFAGKMEFGARALGNRSILANPSKPEVVRKINEQIKNRDFWMPFAPTILAERASDYIINPKNLKAPFMTICFHSTELGRRHFPAAMHPYDFTLRPQILSREENPEYYELVKKFQEKTGIGGMLNTSFNLHGDPIVCSPQDALHTFVNSSLDMLIMEDIVISRRTRL